MAGSTHPVEEGICIAAQRQLLAGAHAAGRARPLLVLAPRRPERFAAVAQWLATQGVKFARSSQGVAGIADAIEVLLLDAMGELLPWYAAADVAFVGGSLVPAGGHNLLEPAALGKPVIAGPHCFNSPEAAELLRLPRRSPPLPMQRSWRRRWKPCWRCATGCGQRCPRGGSGGCQPRRSGRALATIAALPPGGLNVTG